jgi:hypothetical protein
MRVCGVLAALCGAGFLGWAAVLTLHPSLPSRFHSVVADPNLAPSLFMGGAWFLILGISILRARTYRPDLGDAAYLVDPIGAKLQREFPPSRTWWSGDPKSRPRQTLSSAANTFPLRTRLKALRGSGADSRHSSRRRRALGIALVCLGFVGFGHVIYVHFDYGARMPPSPEPGLGRVVPFYANHGLVYGTAEERAHLKQAEILGELGVLLAMVGMYIGGRGSARAS